MTADGIFDEMISAMAAIEDLDQKIKKMYLEIVEMRNRHVLECRLFHTVPQLDSNNDKDFNVHGDFVILGFYDQKRKPIVSVSNTAADEKLAEDHFGDDYKYLFDENDDLKDMLVRDVSDHKIQEMIKTSTSGLKQDSHTGVKLYHLHDRDEAVNCDVPCVVRSKMQRVVKIESIDSM